MNPDFWKNPVAPTTLASIALIVGGLVRILKTKKVGDLLDALPVAVVSRIPKWMLPWLAVALGVAITMLDAKLNGGLKTWGEAFWLAIAGALAGSGAVAGHETLARAIARRRTSNSSPPPPPPPSSKGGGGLRRVAFGAAMVLVCVAMAAGLPSCASFMSALPIVIAAIIDGLTIIDTIEAWVDRYFKQHPDPAKELEVAQAVQRCRLALNAAMRIAEGSKDLSDEKIDAAFENFKEAYKALIHLVQPYGVRVAVGHGVPLMVNATPDGSELEVPTPMAFTAAAKARTGLRR